MSGALAALDAAFPDLTGRSTEEQLRDMQDYLSQLLQLLRYTLRNLGTENFSEAGLAEVNAPVIKELRDAEGGVHALAVTAAALESRITDAEGNVSALSQTAAGLESRVSDTEGGVSSLRQTAAGLESRVSDAEGGVSSLRQTAAGLESRVSAAAGAASAAQQTADAIMAQVTDGAGGFAVLTLRSDGLHIGSATGVTTISGDSLTTGTVTAAALAAGSITGDKIAAGSITGDALAAGSITADEIDATDLHVSSANIDGTLTADRVSADGVTAGTLRASDILMRGAFDVYYNNVRVGTMGAGTGSDGTGTTYGVKLGSYAPGIYLIVTDSGVRMQAGNHSLYVTSGGVYARSGSAAPVDLLALEARVAALEGAV